MRPLRVLQRGVWYEVRTGINDRKTLFRQHKTLTMFTRVFQETKERFVFQTRINGPRRKLPAKVCPETYLW
ncbi:MAG: hypothetical protein LBD74_06455 [Spirochaetaceae bacterium]|nr:hypothetical protein [Spirochaetaceae bacterium]